MQLSNDEKSAIDRDNRQYFLTTGTLFSDFLQQQVLNPLEQGAVGITADARDVNGIAPAGIIVTRDTTSGPGTSLVFGWRTFQYWRAGKVQVTVAAGTLTLSPSTTNFVELDIPTGAVSFNTSGFTTGRYPLFTVTTGVASYLNTGVVQKSPPYALLGPQGVDGTMLSTPGQTKEESTSLILIPTAAGATTGRFTVPSSVAAASKLTKVTFVSRDGLVASDTNYVTFGVVNKQTGAGAQTLVDSTAAANSTKVTGGSALVAETKRDLTLVTLTGGSERDVSPGHTIVWTIAGVGTLPNALRECNLVFEFTFQN